MSFNSTKYMVSTVLSPDVKHIPLAGLESVFMAVDINEHTFEIIIVLLLLLVT